jgi:hypothetical protein
MLGKQTALRLGSRYVQKPAVRRAAFAAALFVLSASSAASLETRSYPEFVQINAIQPRTDGGFAIAGFLRTEGSKVESAFQLIDAQGAPSGRPMILPSPDAQHPQAWVSNILLLPNGDYIAAGWAEDFRGKPDGWLARISPEGDIVWNTLIGHELDQRLYSVKRLSNGRLIAVGRVQQGSEQKQPARGFVVWADESDGHPIAKSEFTYSPNTLRSAFQDVVEIEDGNLVFAGWMTKTDGTDDIWILKTGPDRRPIKSVSFGEAGNDIAYSVERFGTGVVIVGTLRKTRDTSAGSVIIYDKDITQRTILSLDRWAPGQSQGRVMVGLPSTGQVLVAGQIAASSTAEAVALGGVIGASNTTASLEQAAASGGGSSFRAVAVDPAGRVAMAGESREGRDRPLRGLIGLRSANAGCAPQARDMDAISSALGSHAKGRYLACAASDRPARLRIGNGGKNLALVVRPVIGDVDAMLMRGDQIIDASINAMHRPEVLVLPPAGRDLEVIVSANTPFASFEISLAQFDDSVESSTNQDALVAQLLQWLGYDLPSPGDQAEEFAGIGMRRAVMAFQAGEGFPLSGVVTSDDQMIRLSELAARQVDTEARKAAQVAREVAGRSTKEEFAERNPPLSSFTGGIENGAVYGSGQFAFGGQFEGEWMDGIDAGASRRPKLGIIRYSAECSISLRNVAGGTAQKLANLLNASIGVLRRGRTIVFARELASLTSGGGQVRDVELRSLCAQRG